MKIVLQIALLCLCLAGCDRASQVTPEGRLREALSKLSPASTELDRFYALGDAAKQSFVLGKEVEAKKYAEELLLLAKKLPRDWNYGNAIHDGNMVLGRVAAKAGQLDLAKRHLLEAGKTPGSPQLNTFGPNMSLAQDLIGRGARPEVLEYFQACQKFWQMEEGRLNEWAEQVRAGKTPSFGANLYY
jgi:hypothetical protein